MIEDDSLSSNNVPQYTPEEIKEHKRLDKILKKVSKLNPKPKLKPKTEKEKLKNMEIIQNFLGEYLDSYAILGFDTDGEEFILKSTKNTMEERALNDLLNEYFDNGNEIIGDEEEEEDDDEEYYDDED